ncbi:MAG: tetratricopeptide repeat protein [Myxococcota bacterium]|nr:tetratricopeptide repeat protein [Myxococcota bacterium]
MPPKTFDEDNERRQKLVAYDQKDYSEQIEFPVELVDRDGVVRRYSYEESLAVYNRRIQSAPWRYRDEDVIQAEVGHCTRRIAQIMESYNARQRAGCVVPTSNPRATLGPGYEVLMEYYEKMLGRRDLGLQADFTPHLQLLQDSGGCRTYHVGFGTRGGGHILYVYPFLQGVDGDTRAAFKEAQLALRHGAEGQNVERLLLSEETEAAGYILTGSSELPNGLRDQSHHQPGEDTLADATPAVLDASESYEAGISALQAERNPEAVEFLREAVERNPYHREAYLVLLAVLDGSGRYEEARFYGEMAERYLPEDGLVRYRQGINKVRHGDLDGAVVDFDRAGELAPDIFQPPFFAAHVLLVKGGSLVEAAERLQRAAALADGAPRVEGTLRAVQRCIRLRRSVRVSSALLLIGSVALVLAGHLAATPVVLASGLAALVASPFSEALARLLARRGFEEPE